MSKINKLISERKKEENMTYIKYRNYALDVFRYENLPNGMKSWMIEEALYSYGQAFFYFNKALQEFVCLPVYDTAQLNIYGRSNRGRVVSMNGLINDEVEYGVDGVLILNNDSRTPTEGFIREYAEKMSETELAIKLNIHQQKFPYVIACDKKNEMSWRNMYQRLALGEPAVYVSKEMELKDNFNILPSIAPYVADRLNQYRFELEREILTFLGINNNFEKKERVVVDEVNSNNEFIARNVEIQFKNREMAVAEINEMFGLDIKIVKVRNVVREDDIENMMLEETAVELGKTAGSDITEYQNKGNGQLFEVITKMINKEGV